MQVNAPLFAILSGLLEERTGLHYGSQDQCLFVDKVASRARSAGFDSLLDYYYYLRYDPSSTSEFEALVDTLVVTETYFFREVEPLRVAVNHLVAPLVRGGGRARIWCAACASGEEAITLAVLLEDANLLESTDIVASDLTLSGFEEARRHGYGSRSLRALPANAVGRWLRMRGERAWVDERLIAKIDWRRVNLLDAPAIEALGSFDVILCRNVFIYFSDATVARVLSSLTERLNAPHGRLVVGTSESLLRIGTLLQCEEHSGAFLYARNEAGA